MAHLLTAVYVILLGILSCYGLYRYALLGLYYRVRSRRPVPPPDPAEWPSVTIQIPVYNERYVIERAIRSACEVDYPRHRLEIQLLDDSTDDTSKIIARTIEPYQRQGITIHHLHRRARRHFKAGALADALPAARGELIAVFDADFVIPKDFLKRTAPFFSDDRVGMVQTRWGHVNTRYSFLTRIQAVLLDGHFVIEQVARHQAGRFFNFNGTAGIWRTKTIVSSGGWQSDTLTEDLDLSYRAQLAGWRCVFLGDVVPPAELPVEINAFKSQQYRWTRGSIETTRKLLPTILRSPLPLPIKCEAFFHLTSFFIYPLGLVASLGIVPMLLGAMTIPQHWSFDVVWSIFLTAPGIWFFLCAQREQQGGWVKRILMIPCAVAMGMGLLVNNAQAVVDGLTGRSGEFVRTTKFGIQRPTDSWHHKRYRAKLAPTVWIELALAGYFGLGCAIAWQRHLFSTLPYVLLFCLGFTYVGGLSLWQSLSLRGWAMQRLRVRLQPS
ncbi:MAG: glycosyltransferase [Candidatus Omnitrophica bacterium]|nr:glycosyltransferase [Candidatus Omnitrophota bacterium]